MEFLDTKEKQKLQKLITFEVNRLKQKIDLFKESNNKSQKVNELQIEIDSLNEISAKLND